MTLVRFGLFIPQAMETKLFYMPSHFHVEKVPTARRDSKPESTRVDVSGALKKEMMLICNKMHVPKREMGKLKIILVT